MLPVASRMVAEHSGFAFADVFCDRGYFMAAEEALNAHTVKAAYAGGLCEKVGRSSPGYQADITIYDVSCPEEISYNLGFNPVSLAIKGGEVVLAAEEPLLIDHLSRCGTTTAPQKN
jgi:imidazolonepropionase-like amidohydrolase